jgi:hypothetical protein
MNALIVRSNIGGLISSIINHLVLLAVLVCALVFIQGKFADLREKHGASSVYYLEPKDGSYSQAASDDFDTVLFGTIATGCLGIISILVTWSALDTAFFEPRNTMTLKLGADNKVTSVLNRATNFPGTVSGDEEVVDRIRSVTFTKRLISGWFGYGDITVHALQFVQANATHKLFSIRGVVDPESVVKEIIEHSRGHEGVMLGVQATLQS